MADRPSNDRSAVTQPHGEPVRRLTGQKALVTGGSSGIGEGIAIELGKAGADVVVNYLGNREAAEAVAQTIIDNGSKAYAHRADVSDESNVQEMFDRMRREFGTIDILVCNAGIQKDAGLLDMTIDQWRAVLDVNLTGQFLCAREAIREFKRRGVVEEVSCAAGKIISISSVHDIIPWAGHVNYAASKGGVKLLMQSIAQEVAPDRIRVNCLSPGAIRTPINRQAWESQEARDALMTLIPYNRIGEVDDVGRVAAWIASDDADYITGAVLYVDGGMTLYPGFETGG
ncbi:glucose 1-dehydrogenase [candidate division GN15 bacterium]|nr:glucose 1-dehydrogenase [candidate division GN15 bacterium]